MDSLKPVLESNVGELGVRVPFMLRSPEGDTFYLIATDLSVYTRGGWGNNAGQATKTGSHSITLWESHDLVNWTEPRLIEVARKDAGMAWAPEMIYCEETGEYMIFFSSTILDDVSKGTSANIIWRDCVYYTTTRDFKHFGETKRFIPGTDYQADVTSRNESERNAFIKLNKCLADLLVIIKANADKKELQTIKRLIKAFVQQAAGVGKIIEKHKNDKIDDNAKKAPTPAKKSIGRSIE
jgi:hypothetical protein